MPTTMLAFYPSFSEEFQNALRPYVSKDIVLEHLHITLLLLEHEDTEERLKEVLTILSEALTSFTKPLKMSCNGSGVFLSQDKSSYIRVALMNAVGLDVVRTHVMKAFWEKGFLGKQSYGYIPHMTLEYHDNLQLPMQWDKVCQVIPSFEASEVFVIQDDVIKGAVSFGGDIVQIEGVLTEDV